MPDQISALARLAAEAGINVTEGQVIVVSATFGQEQLARAIAGACYDLGAGYVEVNYSDPYVRKARLTRAPDVALGTIPRMDTPQGARRRAGGRRDDRADRPGRAASARRRRSRADRP